MDRRVHHIGCSTIALVFGDITSSTSEVLVSSDDFSLSKGGGVSAAILRAGGSQIAVEASKMVPAALGDVVVTSALLAPISRTKRLCARRRARRCV